MSEILNWENRAPTWDQNVLSIKNGGLGTCWVSVKDQLPKRNIRVLVYLSNSTGSGIELAELSSSDYWYVGDNWNNEFVSKCITHWMPLPQPPKEESNDE